MHSFHCHSHMPRVTDLCRSLPECNRIIDNDLRMGNLTIHARIVYHLIFLYACIEYLLTHSNEVLRACVLSFAPAFT